MSTNLFRFTWKRWLRLLGMATGICTILGEVFHALWPFLVSNGQVHYNLMDISSLLLGIVAGLSMYLLCWRYRPDTAQSRKLSNQEKAASSSSKAAVSSERSFPNAPIRSNAQEKLLERAFLPALRNDLQINAMTDNTIIDLGISRRYIANAAPLQRLPHPLPFVLFAHTIPKEGTNLELSQDKLNAFADSERRRYAVADGVGGSFLPSKWAEIVVDSFVKLPKDFSAAEEFDEWLSACSDQWYQWVDTQWIPYMNKQRRLSYDWSNDRSRGAEATLIGCSFSPFALSESGYTFVRVTAVGDAVFFLVHFQTEGDQNQSYEAFAQIKPEDFGPTPNTIATARMSIQRAWGQVQQATYTARKGDYIILTTDALAKWALIQVNRGKPPWKQLLSLEAYEDFGAFVIEEREKRELETDDTTIMVIPIN